MNLSLPHSVLTTLPAAVTTHHTEVLVIGAGAAGLSAALTAAHTRSVLVLARGELPASNSALAQGGIAAALAASDSPVAHIADTLIAGAGLADESAVATLAHAAPPLMRDLAAAGVPFARDPNASFALGLEGGHSARRIVHVGDATGWAVTSHLLDQARAHPRITLREAWHVADFVTAEGHVLGVLARDSAGTWHRVLANATILASGGAGALYGLTSNQPTALGEGIAMAYRAGAEVADMEFVQFHPTVYRTHAGEGFLITEAARGEGGLLRTPDGQRFMPDYDPRAELAPRDVVTRGIYAAMQSSGSDHVLLDLTHLDADQIEAHFPTICARLRAEGLDPVTTPIPVAPAAHYLMGGVRTDLDGATNLPGLFAAGEVACTGVHGANRLASNSLLECLVFGQRTGLVAAQTEPANRPWRSAPFSVATAPSAPLAPNWRSALATIMTTAAGPLRDGVRLRAGLAALDAWPQQAAPDDAEGLTAANAALTARLILTAALLRQESRGGHFRSDFPQPNEALRAHRILQRDTTPPPVRVVAPAPSLAHAAD